MAGETQEEVKQEETKQEETKQEDQSTTSQSEESKSDAVDETSRDALNLYNSLNDPDKAKDVVKFLASRIGLRIQEDGDVTTKTTAKTLADLKEGVDPQLHFLIDGLKPAIEKMVENAIVPVKQAQLKDREQQVASQINQSYDTMRSRYKDFDKQENRMNKLAEEMPYKPGADMVKYLDNPYKLATIENKEGDAVKGAVDRINKNAKSTHIPSAETSESTVQTGSKLPTLREAVLAGVKGVKLQ